MACLRKYVLPGSPQSAHSQRFLFCGLVPLLPYLLRVSQALEVSTIMTGTVFFAIGSAKSKWSTFSWSRSGLTTLLVGAIAAALAYVTGVLLKSLVW